MKIEELEQRIKDLKIQISDVIKESGVSKGAYYRLLNGGGSITTYLDLYRYIEKKEKEQRIKKYEEIFIKLPECVQVKYHAPLDTFLITNKLKYYKLNYSQHANEFFITCNLNIINKKNRDEYLEETKTILEIYDIVNK